MRQANWEVPCPDASMFIWTKLPKKYQHLSSLDFLAFIRKSTSGCFRRNGFGDMGEGYVRISLVENKNRIRQAIKNIKRFLHE